MPLSRNTASNLIPGTGQYMRANPVRFPILPKRGDQAVGQRGIVLWIIKQNPGKARYHKLDISHPCRDDGSTASHRFQDHVWAALKFSGKDEHVCRRKPESNLL